MRREDGFLRIMLGMSRCCQESQDLRLEVRVILEREAFYGMTKSSVLVTQSPAMLSAVHSLSVSRALWPCGGLAPIEAAMKYTEPGPMFVESGGHMLAVPRKGALLVPVV